MWGYKRLQDMLMVTAILLLLSGYSLSASAAVEQNIRSMTLDQVDSGRLLWKSQAKGVSTSMKAPIVSAGIVEYLPATLLDEDVALNISGLILTATLKQRFKNDTEEWLEAVYAFPLPEDAALYHMEMKVGDRLIIGKIKEQ